MVKPRYLIYIYIYIYINESTQRDTSSEQYIQVKEQVIKMYGAPKTTPQVFHDKKCPPF